MTAGFLPSASVERRLERLEAALDSVDQGFQIIGFDWRYLYVNAAVCRHGHTTREALLGNTMQECYPGIEATPLFKTLEACMRERRAQAFETPFQYPGGGSAWFELRVEPCPDGLSVFSLDITERKALEDRLRHAQKMQAVGRLAGGVAHDFNNLLSVVLSYAAMVHGALPDGSSLKDDVAEIRRAGERAAQLTRQLLTFSRQQVTRPVAVDVGALCQTLAPMFRHLVGPGVELELELGEGVGLAHIDPGQLEQVLMNLVINARDAMPDGGRVTLACQTLPALAAKALPEGRAVPHVLVTVRDTGLGMDAATTQRLFEPFFTTKPVGRGTGLGLATAFGIVKQAHGHIWVESEPGKGSAFHVALPFSDATHAFTPTPVPLRPARGAGEAIVLVEDDEQVRRVARAVLTQAGYRVRDCADTAQARAAAVEPFGLLLTDVVLPDGNGLGLAEELMSARPNLRVLFMSGFRGPEAAAGSPVSTALLLDKPLTPEVLLHRVRDALDSSPPTTLRPE